ncbi:MAG TPA: hypothetical protein VHS78_17310 [Candidatus Elarobacter sp.]|nr:hypothetical protein [Candidatus Elarobacter sp.]
MPSAEVAPGEIAFTFCIEGTAIEAQALLLCESIRRFAGPFGSSQIVAVNPRPHMPVARGTERRLAELGARYVCEPLNNTGSAYLPINRIVTGSWAEAHLDEEYLVLLDSDMLFVAPPSFARAGAGVRPVDVKGATTAGEDDPLEPYWAEICCIAGIRPRDLPFLTPTIERVPVRASYNGGFCVVRRSLGIFTETHRVFEVSRSRDLRPMRNRTDTVYASTGFVGSEASTWWGSSQAALSAAIHARTRDVRVYDDAYNVPLHLIVPDEDGRLNWPEIDPVLLHYHWLTMPEHRAELFSRLEPLRVGEHVRSWLYDSLEAHSRCGAVTADLHQPYVSMRRRAYQRGQGSPEESSA